MFREVLFLLIVKQSRDSKLKGSARWEGHPTLVCVARYITWFARLFRRCTWSPGERDTLVFDASVLQVIVTKELATQLEC